MKEWKNQRRRKEDIKTNKEIALKNRGKPKLLVGNVTLLVISWCLGFRSRAENRLFWRFTWFYLVRPWIPDSNWSYRTAVSFRVLSNLLFINHPIIWRLYKSRGEVVPLRALKVYGEWRLSSIHLNLSTRYRWVISFMPRPIFPRWNKMAMRNDFFLWRCDPTRCRGLLIPEVSRSNITTHHSR
jgi:hypothetical protein